MDGCDVMPSGDKTPIKHPYPCPACGQNTRIRGGRYNTRTGNELYFRYRNCECGCEITTVDDGTGERVYKERKPSRARPRPGPTITQQRRALYDLVRENFRLRQVLGLPLRVGCEPEHYEIAAQLRQRKAA